MTANTAFRLQLLLALGCDRDGKITTETTACVGLEEAGDTCPSADEVDPDELSSAICGARILSVDGGPTEGTCWYGPSADTGGHEGCVYDVTVLDNGDCAYGRPCGAMAPKVARADWPSRLRPRLDAVPRSALASTWTRIGLAEHASIASFARFMMGLMACGAPPALLQEAARAAGDEVLHARLAFGLASAYAGRPTGPGPLVIPPEIAADRVALAVSTVREGCLDETRSAVVLARWAADEPDPAVAAVLRRLVHDERRHAALAWRTVRWAVDSGGAPVRAAVVEALRGGPRDEAWREVIVPVAIAAGMLAA